MPLTDTAVKNAKSGPKAAKLYDAGGLLLIVSPAGAKLRRLKYRFGGTEKTLALGAYPQISLKDARDKRDEAKKLLAIAADKVRRQLGREGHAVARCTVERLMRRHGLRGAVRGKVVRTTIPDGKAACPLVRVNHQFRADRPNQLWVPISPTSRPGRASCAWLSSSTCSRAVSSAGG